MVPSKEQVQTVSTCLQPSLAAEKNELYQASVPYEFSMLIFSLPPLKFEMGLRAASALDSSQNSLHHQGCANVMTTGTLAGEKKIIQEITSFTGCTDGNVPLSSTKIV